MGPEAEDRFVNTRAYEEYELAYEDYYPGGATAVVSPSYIPGGTGNAPTRDYEGELEPEDYNPFYNPSPSQNYYPSSPSRPVKAKSCENNQQSTCSGEDIEGDVCIWLAKEQKCKGC